MNNSNKSICELKIYNNIVNDNKIKADACNNFFINIGPNLARNIPTIGGDISDYLTGIYLNSMLDTETDPMK